MGIRIMGSPLYDITVDDNRKIKFCPFCGKEISFKHPENYD